MDLSRSWAELAWKYEMETSLSENCLIIDQKFVEFYILYISLILG